LLAFSPALAADMTPPDNSNIVKAQKHPDKYIDLINKASNKKQGTDHGFPPLFTVTGNPRPTRIPGAGCNCRRNDRL